LLKQAARNTGLGLVGNAAGLGLQLIASILIARNLGAAGFGIYAAALAFANLFASIADAGVYGGLSRELVLADDAAARRLIGAGLLIKVIAAALCYPALLLVASAAGFTTEAHDVVAVMGIAYLCAVVAGQTALSAARARGRMEVDAALTAGYSTVFAVCVAFIAPDTPSGVAWSWLVAYGAFAAAGLMILFRWYPQPIWQLDPAVVRSIWRVGLPLGFAALLLIVYTRLPIYLLTAFSAPEQIGLFNAAFGLPRNLQAIAMTLSAALGPIFVRLAADDPAQLRTAYATALRATLLLMLPIGAGATILAEPILLLLFGPAYTLSADVLALGCWSLCCYTLSFVGQTLLAAIGRGGRWLAALGAGTLGNGLIGLALIPHYGATGAAWAALAADLLVLLLLLGATRAHIAWSIPAGALVRGGAGAAIMALTLYALPDLPLWGSIPLGAAVYAAALITTRAVMPHEIRRITGRKGGE
jgi:O-antigen/teichoic acid export membrane protein